MSAEDTRSGPTEDAPLRLRLRVAAEPMAVRAALRAAVQRFARRLGPQVAGALELALAEVLNNIVEHAYAGRSGSIALSIALHRGMLLCLIVDHGRAMPGLALPAGQSPQSLAAQRDQLREGGWGWHLIRSLTRDLVYSRAGGANRLRFRIDLGAAADADQAQRQSGARAI